MAHSEKESERSLVNGEQSRSQRIIGLPFTVYLTLCALRLALCVKGAAQSRFFWDLDPLVSHQFHDFREQSKIFCSIIHSNVASVFFYPDTRNLTPDT
jgi:hypothetical protein